jgi:CBS domain-containing protein
MMRAMSEPTRAHEEHLRAEDLREIWSLANPEEKVEGFRSLSFSEAEELFLSLDSRAQCDLLTGLPSNERQLWMRQLPPDDAADVCQKAEPELRDVLLRLLDEPTRKEVSALLAYAEDEAGGLMSPRYVRLRPDMSVDEAIKYLRRAALERAETIYYIYVLDAAQRLVGVVSFRELFGAPPDRTVRDVMRADVLAVRDDLDQEAVANVMAESKLMAVPVVDAEGTHPGHRDRRRHRRGRARRGHRGHPEDRRYRRARRALPRDRHPRADPQARGLAHDPVLRRAAHGQRDGLLRRRDRASGGTRPLHSPDHLERRQLGIAGEHARDPCARGRRSASARLVARVRARARRRAWCSG